MLTPTPRPPPLYSKPLAQVEFIAGEGTVHRISWQDLAIFVLSAEREAEAVGGLLTFFLVASCEREFIVLECVLQPPFESLCPSVNSWHGIDHGEVQAHSLPSERSQRCERPHLRGKNETSRARASHVYRFALGVTSICSICETVVKGRKVQMARPLEGMTARGNASRTWEGGGVGGEGGI